MAKPKAKLEYIFFFEDDSPFRSAFQFEQALSDFFAAHGLIAETFPQVEGDTSRKMVWLSKIEPVLTGLSSATEKSSTITSALSKAKNVMMKGK